MNAVQHVGSGMSPAAARRWSIAGMVTTTAGAGGVVGATIGALASNDMRGTAIGAAVGAGLGALIGGLVGWGMTHPS